jgi:hypothetical protein
VNEGHLRLRAIPRQYTKAEQKAFKTKKPLFALLDYRILDDKMFVVENKENVGQIKRERRLSKSIMKMSLI